MKVPAPQHTVNELKTLFKELNNWGKWGESDEMGTLNYLTPELTAAAMRGVQTGESVSLGLPLSTEPAIDNPHPVTHLMIQAGDVHMLASTDYVGMAVHGMTISHIDALCHIFWEGKSFNGQPEGAVKSTGATTNSIAVLKNGISARGVLLDIPRLLGVDWLEPGAAVERDDLEQAEKKSGVQVQRGDALLIRTGRFKRREKHGAWDLAEGLAGLDIGCLPWISQREACVLGSDGISEILPFPVPDGYAPIHQVALTGMGMYLLDNLDMEGLSAKCAERNKWEFFLTVSPLYIKGGTGCAVNPLAIF
jgi:kynurenine formamidase